MTTRNSPFMKTTTAAAVLMLLGGVALSGFAVTAGLSAYDKTFLTKAADAGSTEIAASKIAATKGTNEAVKTFAASMVSDHSTVADELKQLATSKGLTPSEELSQPHQAEISKLSALEGPKFDTEYAQKIGVAAHTDAVKLFTDASKKANDPDVKAFAAKTLPALQHHLQMAKQLNSTVMAKQ